jgi:hypothetical protein
LTPNRFPTDNPCFRPPEFRGYVFEKSFFQQRCDENRWTIHTLWLLYNPIIVKIFKAAL